MPPPVDGRAVATSWLVDALRSRSVELWITDTQLPAGAVRPLRKLYACLRAAASVAARPPAAMIVVASGGAGLVAELVPILAGTRICRQHVYLIHHSGSYAREQSSLVRAILWLAGSRLRHVLLSEEMRTEFCETYGVDSAETLVVGNAGLMSETSVVDVERRRTLLHVSNLSAEKGSLVAIKVAARLGAPIHLGGPAETGVVEAIAAANSVDQHIQYLGPLHGESKARELWSARVFLFPSTYVHEAQPLVVYEAAQAGAVPVVWSSGWVAEQMSELGLSDYVFEQGDIDGLATTAERLLAMPDEEFERLSAEVRSAFEEVSARGAGAVDALADELRR